MMRQLISTACALAFLGFSTSASVSLYLDGRAVNMERAKTYEFEPERDGRPVEDISDYSFIWESGIFGKPLAEEVEKEEEPVIVPFSPSYKLLGTIVGSRTAIAIIKMGTEAEYFNEGDNIGSGKVARIEPDRVIIETERGKEALLLFEEWDEGMEASRPSGPPSTSRTTSRWKSTPKTPVEVRKVAEGSYVVAKSEVEKVFRNIGSLLMQARAVPYIVDGKIAGFRLFRIKPGSLYEKIGLKNGDIVKAINGVPIDSPETALRIFSELRNETYFEVEIMRGGRPMTLTYNLR